MRVYPESESIVTMPLAVLIGIRFGSTMCSCDSSCMYPYDVRLLESTPTCQLRKRIQCEANRIMNMKSECECRESLIHWMMFLIL